MLVYANKVPTPLQQCEFLLVLVSYYEELDSFNEWKISAFVSPGQTKYLLMHRNECREGISAFFKEVHQHYVEVRAAHVCLTA